MRSLKQLIVLLYINTRKTKRPLEKSAKGMSIQVVEKEMNWPKSYQKTHNVLKILESKQ